MSLVDDLLQSPLDHQCPRGSQEFKNYPGSIFFVKALDTSPPPAFQTRYVFVQEWYVFPTLLLKKFLAALLVGCKPFPAFKWI